jgi:hypothetical protein
MTSPKDITDPRRRYFHGAVDVSTLGKNEPRISPSTGVALPCVEGSPSYNMRFNADLSETGITEIGYLTQGVWFDADWLVSHLDVTATATVQLVDSGGSVVLSVAIPASAGAAGAAALVPTDEDLLVRVNVSAAGAANEVAALTMRVVPSTPGWF